MYLIVGLGNPGSEYQRTRHNVGFEALEVIREKYSFDNYSKKFKGLYTMGQIGGSKVILLKPGTYMNLSGESVRAAKDFYKISIDNIIVIHDDIDLAIGVVKVKTGGGSGGHNGIKSIDLELGSPDYTRVRIGVGRSIGSAIDIVLGKYSSDEGIIYEEVYKKIAENIGDLLVGEREIFLNKIYLQEKKMER